MGYSYYEKKLKGIPFAMLFISRLFIHYTNIKIYIIKSLSVTSFTNNIVKLENNK